MTGLREVVISCKEQGKVLLAIVTPEPDVWGITAPLVGSVWQSALPVVPAQTLETALLGWATPLMRVIGPSPRELCLKYPFVCSQCNIQICPGANKSHCKPGKRLPVCYTPPSLTPEQTQIAAMIALYWKEDRYVVLIG